MTEEIEDWLDQSELKFTSIATAVVNDNLYLFAIDRNGKLWEKPADRGQDYWTKHTMKKRVEQRPIQKEAAPTLEEWLDQWEAAVLDGQSSISREEAIRRYEKEHG